MNERQKLNKIIHNYVEVNKNEDYTNYKGLITALIEWKNEQLTLTDVSKCNCDGNDDVFEEQYVLQHLINNTWQVVGEKTNTVWKQGKKEDCIKWMDL